MRKAMNATARRDELYTLLGELPQRNCPISVQQLSRVEREGYVLETLLLNLNGLEPVPACFVRPSTGGPFATILYNHAHGGDYVLGKRELLDGRAALQDPPYAIALTEQGLSLIHI